MNNKLEINMRFIKYNVKQGEHKSRSVSEAYDIVVDDKKLIYNQNIFGPILP